MGTELLRSSASHALDEDQDCVAVATPPPGVFHGSIGPRAPLWTRRHVVGPTPSEVNIG